jgi:DnaJ-class molecular chaperone
MTTGQALYNIIDRQDYLKKVHAAMMVRSHYIPCPAGCANGQFMVEHDCQGMGYAPGGCPLCNNLGFTAKECETCHGDGEVVVTEDEGLEVFEVTG